MWNQEFGFNALLSLRLEKGFGIWSAEFTQGYTPGMTGMDRWIDWGKTNSLVNLLLLKKEMAMDLHKNW